MSGIKEPELATMLMGRIQSGNSLYGYQEQFDELYDLVDQTVSTGGSNSVLILGPRGVGKKVMVNQVLARVLKESQVFRTDGLTVRLNGLVETDDKSHEIQPLIDSHHRNLTLQYFLPIEKTPHSFLSKLTIYSAHRWGWEYVLPIQIYKVHQQDE